MLKHFTLNLNRIQEPFNEREKTVHIFATPGTTGSPAKWRLRNEHRNSKLMTRHYSDLGSASDWLKICFFQS